MAPTFRINTFSLHCLSLLYKLHELICMRKMAHTLLWSTMSSISCAYRFFSCLLNFSLLIAWPATNRISRRGPGPGVPIVNASAIKAASSSCDTPYLSGDPCTCCTGELHVRECYTASTKLGSDVAIIESHETLST